MKTAEQYREQAVSLLWPTSANLQYLTYDSLGSLVDKEKVDRIAIALRTEYMRGAMSDSASQKPEAAEDDSFSVEVGGQRFTAAQWAAVLTYSRAMKETQR